MSTSRQLHMDDKDILDIRFDQIDNIVNTDYMDGDIAFYKDFREMPISEQGSLRIDMYIAVLCTRGKLKVEINATPYTIEQNSIIVSYPNAVIDNCMLSPNFEGSILCLSHRIISECVSESDLWERAFHFMDNPIIRVSEDELNKLRLYKELLQIEITTKNNPFLKDIIFSIIKAISYELLASAGTCTPSLGTIMVKQREILFKRFIQLLSGCKIKPRSVTWYADQLCITSKHLSSVCKQVSGRTAFDWINEYVRNDIRRMLKNSQKTIKEVADYLGFPNISFFGKYCRTHFGSSPTELRRQLREQSKK